jgi:transposase
LIDESGLLMAPLVRRTWAPRGRPPALSQKAAHREKVSVAAALWLPPAGGVRLFTRRAVNGFFNAARVADFLLDLGRAVGGPVIAVWDGGPMHRGDPIRELVADAAGGLMLEPLPAYGSELMPVEFLWAWLKYDRLANFVPHDAAELDAAIRAELTTAAADPALLASFFRRSKLPMSRALLM